MSTLASKNRQVTTGGGKRQLTNSIGEVVLEEVISTDDLLYVKKPGTFVSKTQLEDLLDVTIIEKENLPPITRSLQSGYGLNDFKVGTVGYHYRDDVQLLRNAALRMLAAANEITRHHAAKKAEEERKEAERVAEQARLKALAEEGKKRREIGVLRDLLEEEGTPWPQSTAEALYEAGVRKV